MINFDLVSRNVPNPKAFSDIKNKRLELKKAKAKRQGALKLVIDVIVSSIKNSLNSTRGVIVA